MITFDDVSFRYAADGPPILRSLSLHIPQGSLLALVGPSGCGKSTALKLINRLQDPSAGRVLVGGTPTTDVPAQALRRRIGIVFQHGGLFPHLTIEQNLCLVARLSGWPRDRLVARANHLLDIVGLDPGTFAGRYPAALSGGQRQRVAFARAIFLEQDIVLLDEPFSALDPVTRDELQRFFRSLQQQLSLTVVLVTHDMAEALLLADRIALLEQGRAVADGTPRELLHAQGPPLLRQLLDTPLRQTRQIETLLDPVAASVNPTTPTPPSP